MERSSIPVFIKQWSGDILIIIPDPPDGEPLGGAVVEAAGRDDLNRLSR